MTEVAGQAHAPYRRVVARLTILGIATVLTACGSSGERAGSPSPHPGVVTTIPGGDTCHGRSGRNEAPADLYRRQYADGLVKQLKARLSTYDLAVASGASASISEAARDLGAEVRVDAHLIDVPRLYGCYDQNVLTDVQKAAHAFATTLDALSCAGANLCNRKQTEVPGLLAQANPQELAYIAAINTYAAQFGAEQLPSLRSPPTT